MSVLFESGWYCRPRSNLRHYIYVHPSHVRATRGALCGAASTEWSRPNRSERTPFCAECAEARSTLGGADP